jgi:hypothetical protein
MASRRSFTRLYRAARLSNIPAGRLLRRDGRTAAAAEMSDTLETFEIDTELTRDAIYAGIWTRLCVEMRTPPEENRLEQYIDRLAKGRGDPTELLGYLDTDIGWLTDARRRLRAVEGTPLGSEVALDDVRRFMPKAWHEEPGQWIYTDTELREIEEHGGHVLRVREFGRPAMARSVMAAPLEKTKTQRLPRL